MNEKGLILMLFGVIGVLLTILALGTYVSSEWTTVGQEVAPVVLIIVLVGLVIGIVWGRK